MYIIHFCNCLGKEKVNSQHFLVHRWIGLRVQLRIWCWTWTWWNINSYLFHAHFSLFSPYLCLHLVHTLSPSLFCSPLPVTWTYPDWRCLIQSSFLRCSLPYDFRFCGIVTSTSTFHITFISFNQNTDYILRILIATNTW